MKTLTLDAEASLSLQRTALHLMGSDNHDCQRRVAMATIKRMAEAVVMQNIPCETGFPFEIRLEVPDEWSDLFRIRYGLAKQEAAKRQERARKIRREREGRTS